MPAVQLSDIKPSSSYKSKGSNADTDDEYEDATDRSILWEKIKEGLLIFLLFIVLSTDVFIDQILNKFDGAVNSGYSTMYGTILQGIFLVIGYIIIDLLVNTQLI